MVVEKNVWILMRERGVHLAADIYRPARDGKPAQGRFPTRSSPARLTTRTAPATRVGITPSGLLSWLANDVRGRYASEGTWRLIDDDPTDGYEVVEWIAGQNWSDGKVGTFGTSYPGGTQSMLWPR